jgi:hypothetical protein
LLDPQSSDLIRLTAQTAELPVTTNACQATSKVEYQRVGVHGQNVLVPRETDLRTTFRDGTETVGLTSYSNCRQYAGRTVMRFDVAELATKPSAAPTAVPSAAAVASIPFALGLTFECRIVTSIDSNTPAGRPIEALLLTQLRGKDGEIVAPVGSHIHGRLVRLVEYKSPRNYYEADVRLDSIEVGGTDLPLYAVPAHQSTPSAGTARKLAGSRLSDFVSSAPRNIGAFFFDQKHLDVRQWDSNWLTTFPEASAGANKQTQLVSNTPQQVSENEAVQNFVLAIHYSQEATDLLGSNKAAASVAANPRLPDILAYSRKAIEAGKAADPARLNDLYPGLGDNFRFQFLDALTLFVHSCEVQATSASVARAELSRSTLLYDEWMNWYDPLRGDINHAVSLTVPNPSPVAPQ